MQFMPVSDSVHRPSSLVQADGPASQAGSVGTRTNGKHVWPGPCRFMFLTLMYFNFYGIACVAVTPNLLVAAVLSGAFYGNPRPDQAMAALSLSPASHVLSAVYGAPPCCSRPVSGLCLSSVVLLTVD